MKQKVLTFIKKHHMLQPNDAVLIGVSGGADSVGLLVFLKEAQNLLGIQLFAVHVNHQFRGAQADRDEAYVKELCKRLDTPFAAVSVSMEQKAKAEKLTLEEAGRLLRYEIFDQKAKEWHCQKIAVAHHQDDQAETMLFQMFRGSGLKGVSGMAPVRGKIIRPFLCIEREEIEQYLKEHNISYCTDSTNLSNDYSRNKIRNQLIPFLKNQINKGTVRHLLQLSELAREADAHLMREAKALFSQYAIAEEGALFLSASAWREDKIVADYLIRLCLQEIIGSGRDIAFVHIKDIYELQEREIGKQICLPGDCLVRKEADSLKFMRKKKGDCGASDCQEIKKEPPLALEKAMFEKNNDKIEIKKAGRSFTFQVRSRKKNEKFEKNVYTKCFDYDKIKNIFFLRTRESGDFIVIDQQGSRKKLKKYFIDQKIDASQRDQLLLLANGSEIIWIVGYRISEFYKVSEQTEQVLEVTVTEDKNGGSNK